MRIFYVDYENVQSLGVNGIDKLEADDKVVILYSEHADSMKIDIVRQIQSTEATVEFIVVDAGTPNALDFQLLTCLFIDINDQDEIYIVSRDTGFDAAIKMAERKGFANIKRITTIDSLINPNQEDDLMEILEKAEINEETKTSISITLPIAADDNYSKIEEIIEEKCGNSTCRKYSELIITGLKKSSNKNQVYQFFRSSLGDEKGGDLYRSIRNKYDEMKALI